MITMTQRAISERDVYKDLRLSDIDKKLKKKQLHSSGIVKGTKMMNGIHQRRTVNKQWPI